jgi:hypothetical protein
MGNANSNSKTSIATEISDDLVNKVHSIATNYILTQNFQDMRNLSEVKYCNKLVMLTADILKNNLSEVTLKHLSDKVSGTETVRYFKKSAVAEDKVGIPANSAEKQELCAHIATFYVMIAHVFAAIVTTIHPNYVYTNKEGISVSETDRQKIPETQVQVNIPPLNNLCQARINILTNGQSFLTDEIDAEQEITIKPQFCQFTSTNRPPPQPAPNAFAANPLVRNPSAPNAFASAPNAFASAPNAFASAPNAFASNPFAPNASAPNAFASAPNPSAPNPFASAPNPFAASNPFATGPQGPNSLALQLQQQRLQQQTMGGAAVTDNITRSLMTEPGMPEFEQLYYDEYDAKTGKFSKMSQNMRTNVYEKDVATFYKTFASVSDLPKTVPKTFKDINLRDYSKQPSCEELNKNKNFSVTGSLKEKLFKDYAERVKSMIKSNRAHQEQLIQILDNIFVSRENGTGAAGTGAAGTGTAGTAGTTISTELVTINPSLTEKTLPGLIELTRTTIMDMYLTCEQNFLESINLYEAIAETQLGNTSESQVSNLNKFIEEKLKDDAEHSVRPTSEETSEESTEETI